MVKGKIDWPRYFGHYDIMMEKANIPYQELERLVHDKFSEFDLRDGSLILDAGTGTGRFAKVIASLYPNSKVIGLDIVPECRDKLREKSEKYNLHNLEFGIADITNLEDILDFIPEGKKEADAINCIHTLYLIPEDKLDYMSEGKKEADAINCIHTLYLIPEDKQYQVLKNFNEALRKDGYLLISEIGGELKVDEWRKYLWEEAVERYGIIQSLYLFAVHSKTLAEENKVIQKRQLGELQPKIRMFSLDEFGKMVKDAGFDIIFSSDKYYRGIDRTIIAKKK